MLHRTNSCPASGAALAGAVLIASEQKAPHWRTSAGRFNQSFAITSVAKATDDNSICAQILSGGFARPSVCDNVERDLLTFVEAAHARAFDSANMNEDIFVPVVRRDKAEAFLAV